MHPDPVVVTVSQGTMGIKQGALTGRVTLRGIIRNLPISVLLALLGVVWTAAPAPVAGQTPCQLPRPMLAGPPQQGQTAQPPQRVLPPTPGAGQRIAPPIPPIVVCLITLRPAPLMANQSLSATFGLFNNGTRAISGRVVGDIDGVTFRGGLTAQISDLGPNEATSGVLIVLEGIPPGDHTLTLRYQEASLTGVHVGPNGKLEGTVVWTSRREAQYDVYVADPAPILTSSDRPPQLPAADWRPCGANGLQFPDPKLPIQWAEPVRDAILPFTGTAIDTHEADHDAPFSHPFGFDFNWYVVPDSGLALESMLNNGNHPDSASCSSAGLQANLADGDLCAAYGKAGAQAPGVLGVEVEAGLLPVAYRPRPNDRVVMHGHWIVDCGHDYHAEMHPAVLLAAARIPAGHDVEATIIAVPYRTTEWQYGPEPFRPLIEHLGAELTKVALLFSTGIESRPTIDLKPFRTPVTAHYRFTVPRDPTDLRKAPRMAYHFTTRPGVSVAVTRADSWHADMTITLNPATYTPSAPTCFDRVITLGEADSLAGWPQGIIEGMVAAASSVRGDPLVHAILNKGVTISSCAVAPPPKQPDDSPGTTVTRDAIQPYPVYGWIRFVY